VSVVGVSFAFFMGHSIILPSLALYASSLEASSAQIGLIVAGFAIGRMAFNALGGIAADRFGIRLVAAFGCLVTFAGALLAGAAPGINWLLAARLVQGAGSAFYLIPAYAYVASLGADDGLGRMLSLYQGTLLIGNAFGPAVGGLVATWWGLQAPNYVFAGLVAVGLVLTLVCFPGTAAQFGLTGRDRVGGRSRGAIRALMLRRVFAIPMVVCLVTFALRAGIRVTMLPLFATAAFRFSEGQVGLLMTVATVSNVAIIPYAGGQLDRIGRRPIVIWSMVATALVLVGLALTTTSWMLYLGASLLGIVTGYAGVAPAAIAADISNSGRHSAALGLQRMVSDLGIVTGPLFVGWMLGMTSFRGAFAVCALVAAGTTVVSLFMSETLGMRGLTRHRPRATA
jgi:MFS family permease